MAGNTNEKEKEILKFWQDNQTFKKSIRDENSSNFVFYEGPPTANAAPGIHHAEARAFKDVICRYKSMKGFRVLRKAGWDTHGLPVEIQIEKELGLKDKKGIENYGLEKFNKKCRDSVWRYKKDWEALTKRMGYWLDMNNPYITYEDNYIESVWWILKQIWDKGLLFQDYKIVPFCPRCGTTLSSHELAQGYRLVKEPSVYLKLLVEGQENTYLLVWTTTPWTLPGNVAVAVNPHLNYVKVEQGGEKYILAKDTLVCLGEGEHEIKEEFLGKDLIGWKYKAPYAVKPEKKERIYEILEGDFITSEEGTGLVHIAPAFGEDDYQLIKSQESQFAFLMTVDGKGNMKTPNYAWDQMFVKEADPLIIKDLKERNILFREELYEHDYPFCWRCDTPLIYYAQSSWFIKMTELREKLIANNEKINWIPQHLKKGRFGEWLREVKDWNLSRERYWGTPLPIWQCENKECNHQQVIGSIQELKDLSGQDLTDLHRPAIDEVIFSCKKCGSKMHRVPEVIDCWFDSGSMPFAQQHYPFENKELIDQGQAFPADFISEGIDQTRGWFYTLLAISTLLEKEPAYRNVITVGIILDEKGQKMSKSKGNIVIPKEVIEKVGADCLRLYFYTLNQVDQSKKFSQQDLQDLHRKFFFTLNNCLSFWKMYEGEESKQDLNLEKVSHVLDRWIISRLQSVIQKVNENMDKYDVVSAARLFLDLVDDLSNWYIRRSRSRFQKPNTPQEKEEASLVLRYLLLEVARLLAPFTPFVSEEIYQILKKEEDVNSIHLTDYPQVQEKYPDQELEKNMAQVKNVASLGLAERVKAGIKVKQPLSLLKVSDKEIKDSSELLDLIKEEINVKAVQVDSELKEGVWLDLELTPELKAEGQVREVVRAIQRIKKEAEVCPQDQVQVAYQTEDLQELLEKYQDLIKKETRVEFIDLQKGEFSQEKKIKIDDKEITLYLKVAK
ncbi:isoleucine--tRNA ligase [Patescibacteria group bacterium]|nr:isoleucine--tRNA ligase [Patescibacteria group bacterium]